MSQPLPRRRRPGYQTVLYGDILESRARYRATRRTLPAEYSQGPQVCEALLRGLRNL